MTQEQILEYNKRCAKFIGYSSSIPDTDFYFVERPDKKDTVIPKLLELNFEKRFYSDWNWIMEVVEGIENIQIKGQYIFYVYPKGATCEIKCSTQFDLANDNKMPCIITIGKSKKEAVVQAINEFLIWYEQNK